MNKSEARQRAQHIWSGRQIAVTTIATPGADACIEVEGDTRWHWLSSDGHVVCEHPECIELERIAGPPTHQ